MLDDDEPLRVALLIAYWGDDRDVSYLTMTDGYPDTHFYRLFGRMEDYLVNGHVTEVLEFHPDLDEPYATDLGSDRCDWWREQLYAQGYDIAT